MYLIYKILPSRVQSTNITIDTLDDIEDVLKTVHKARYIIDPETITISQVHEDRVQGIIYFTATHTYKYRGKIKNLTDKYYAKLLYKWSEVKDRNMYKEHMELTK